MLADLSNYKQFTVVLNKLTVRVEIVLNCLPIGTYNNRKMLYTLVPLRKIWLQPKHILNPINLYTKSYKKNWLNELFLNLSRNEQYFMKFWLIFVLNLNMVLLWTELYCSVFTGWWWRRKPVSGSAISRTVHRCRY